MPMTKIQGTDAFDETEDAVLVLKANGQATIYIPDTGDDDAEVPFHVLLASALFFKLDDHDTVVALVDEFCNAADEAEGKPS